jgi:hypothetical protein
VPAPIAKHQMNDEAKNDYMKPECVIVGHMSKTFSQTGLEFQLRKQRLNDHQACKRREPLILESELRDLVDTAPALVDFVTRNFNFTN